MLIKEIKALLLSSQNTEKDLYLKAKKLCLQKKGKIVLIRGIIEFSNYCIKDCAYCGIRKSNKQVQRYRMSIAEIIARAKEIYNYGIKTVVLQSGEDPYYTKDILSKLIVNLKKETSLKITFSIGQRDKKDLEKWVELGLDRYFIRFETANPQLFKSVHPDTVFAERLNFIKQLKDIGLEVGSGFLMGLPQQTLDDLAYDLYFCANLKLDMIGIGPFIPSPNTPLANLKSNFDNNLYLSALAILRLLNPDANIPATTAFDILEPNARLKLLDIGANVYMPNCTPDIYKQKYLLYPKKQIIDQDFKTDLQKIKQKTDLELIAKR